MSVPQQPRASVHGLYGGVCAVRVEGRTIGRVEKRRDREWWFGRGQCAITEGPYKRMRDAVEALRETVA